MAHDSAHFVQSRSDDTVLELVNGVLHPDRSTSARARCEDELLHGVRTQCLQWNLLFRKGHSSKSW